MKKLITVLAVSMVAAWAACAQGTVRFANFGNGLNAPDFLDYGRTTLVPGPRYMAALLAGPAANRLSQIATTPYVSGAGAGYFAGGVQTIPGVAGGSPALILIEAWDTAAGSTFPLAQNSLSPGSWAWSNNGTPFSVTTGDPNASPPGLPATLTGLTSFSFNVTEPSVLALAVLGAATTLVFRRRK
jgi:hypothetical protein